MTDFNVASEIRFGAAPYFVFCDHASNVIPADLKCLGMPEDLLQTHIAWDIGAGALAEAIAQSLDATLFTCNFSRLIIDPNRDIHAQDFIPPVSDQIPVPGNQMLSEAAIRNRVEQFYVPYHQQLGASLDGFSERCRQPFVVSVHSFTNRLMGAADDRPWHVGLLWREDETSARAAMRVLARNTDWSIGDNEPYDARVFNYSIDRHVSPRGLRHITLEVRQDLAISTNAVAQTAATLSDMISSVAAAECKEREAS